jgi:hypothetical protein
MDLIKGEPMAVDITQQALVVEVVPELAVLEFTEDNVLVEIVDGTPLVEFGGCDGGGGGGTGSAMQFQDEGIDLGGADADTLNFVGALVEATRDGNTVTATINAASDAETDAGVVATKGVTPDSGAYAYDRLRHAGQHEAGKATAAVPLIPDTGVVTVDGLLSNVFELILNEDVEFANPVNPINGQTVNIYIRQNAIGGFNGTFGTQWSFVNKIDPIFTQDANAVDILSCAWDVTLGSMRCVHLPNYGSGETEIPGAAELLFNNVGAGAEIIRDVDGFNVNHRTITGTGEIVVTQNADEINISLAVLGTPVLAFTDLTDVDMTGAVTGNLLQYGPDGVILPVEATDAVDTTVQSFVTSGDETETLPNSRQLVAGTGIEFSYDTANELRIDVDVTAVTDGTQTGATVRRTTDQSMGTATYTPISFDTEDKDDESYWTVGSPTQFTILTAGWYAISGNVSWGATSTNYGLFICKNGSASVTANRLAGTYDAAFANKRQSISCLAYLQAGDDITLEGYSAGAGTIIGATIPAVFSIVRSAGVGATGAAGPDGAQGSGGGAVYAIYKDADEARSSTTVLADDSTLKATLLADTKYVLEFEIFTDASVTPDLKYDFNFTGTTTSVLVRRSYSTHTTASVAAGVAGTDGATHLASALNVVTTFAVAGTDTVSMRITVNIEVGASGGVFSFRWAQGTSSGTAVTVRRNSSLTVTQANGSPIGTQSGCIVSRTALQTFTTTGSYVSFDTEIQDDEGYWSAGTPTIITIPTDGWYNVVATVAQSTDPDDAQTLYVEKNGAATYAGQHITRLGISTAVACHSQIVDLCYYEAGDTLKLVVVNRSGTSTAYVRFSILRAAGVGPQGEGVPIGGTAGQFLTKVSDTANDVTWVTPPTGGGAMQYVAESIVAGAAATNITISGLNLAADSTYFIEYAIKHAAASATYSLFVNGDTVTTNYDTENFGMNAGANGGTGTNNAAMATSMTSGLIINGQAYLRLDADGKPSFQGTHAYMQSTPIRAITIFAVTHRTAANLTSFTLNSSTASGFAVGSYIRVYRVSKKAAAGGNGQAGAALEYVGQTVVSGAAATDITVSGLDLATDENYIINIEAENALASAPTLSWHYNSDFTAGNYDNQRHSAASTTNNSAGANNAEIGLFAASSQWQSKVQLTADIDGNGVSIMNSWCGQTGGTHNIELRTHRYRTTANITSITLRSSTASAFAIGSKITVWRMKRVIDHTLPQSADLVITSNNVFQDTSCMISLPAGTYTVDYYTLTSVNTTPDMEVQLNYTGTVVNGYGRRQSYRTGATSSDGYLSMPMVYLMNDTATFVSFHQATIEVSTAGVLSLQARQVTSSGTSVTFKKGSWMRVRKILG